MRDNIFRFRKKIKTSFFLFEIVFLSLYKIRSDFIMIRIMNILDILNMPHKKILKTVKFYVAKMIILFFYFLIESSSWTKTARANLTYPGTVVLLNRKPPIIGLDFGQHSGSIFCYYFFVRTLNTIAPGFWVLILPLKKSVIFWDLKFFWIWDFVTTWLTKTAVTRSIFWDRGLIFWIFSYLYVFKKSYFAT